MGRGMGPMGGIGRMPQAMDPGKNDTFEADFNSNATTIDIRGGERLSGRGENAVTTPGEMLLLDADGFLIVRNELDDASTRKQVTTARQSSTGNMRGLRGMPGAGLSPFGPEGFGMPGAPRGR